MTDRPIIFSGPMVRAILREIEHPGTGKTQTRRVLKPQFPPQVDKAGFTVLHPPGFCAGRASSEPGSEWHRKLPYAIGDRLWVREAFQVGRAIGGYAPGVDPDTEPNGPTVDIVYRADGENGSTVWNPSIHMPRRFSRLTLTVTDVWIERIQDISEADAIAEGIIQDRVIVDVNGAVGAHHEEYAYRYWIGTEPDDFEGHEYAEDAFAVLWDNINARRGYGWDANPWVEATTFTAEQRNIDAEGADHAPR